MTTTKAASNGSKPATSMPDNRNGRARVQEAQAYHMVAVAHTAAYEAERLIDEIYRAASDAYLPSAGESHVIDVLADPVMDGKADEAVFCLLAAVLQLTDMFGGPAQD
jgi:hypothetical protein